MTNQNKKTEKRKLAIKWLEQINYISFVTRWQYTEV